jgi:hypothetical protein
VNYVLQDEEIARIAKMLMELQEREDTALPLLRKELEDTDKGLKNIADAIQQGIITTTTKQRLEGFAMCLKLQGFEPLPYCGILANAVPALSASAEFNFDLNNRLYPIWLKFNIVLMSYLHISPN